MHKLLKASVFTVFALTSLVSTNLSAWYDPTGYWGRHYPTCYTLPSRGKFTIRAELLYLRAHVDNVKINNSAIENADDFANIPGLIFNFTNDERKRRFKWKYGGKIGFGFACNDCWEADVNWTKYQTKALLSDFGEAETKWKLHLDLYDLEIGKEMWFRRCFRLKPFIGLRFAEIKQKFDFEVEGTVQSIFLPGILSPFELDGVLRHNYLAGGPRIGADFSWCLGCGFSFYIIGAASFVYGEMQNRYKDNFIVDGVDRDHHWEGTGITDLSCGVGWSDLWWNERRRLTFRFGYEHHFFIHQNKLDVEGAVRRSKNNWFVHGIGGTIAVDF